MSGRGAFLSLEASDEAGRRSHCMPDTPAKLLMIATHASFLSGCVDNSLAVVTFASLGVAASDGMTAHFGIICTPDVCPKGIHAPHNRNPDGRLLRHLCRGSGRGVFDRWTTGSTSGASADEASEHDASGWKVAAVPVADRAFRATVAMPGKYRLSTVKPTHE